MSNKISDMITDDKIIISLEESSWPAQPSNPSQIWDKKWLSGGMPQIGKIPTFSFDRIKELSDIENVASCDAFFYCSGANEIKNEVTSFLFEFKDTNSTHILKEYVANTNSDKNYQKSINRKINDSAHILKTIEFAGISGQELLKRTHIIIVYKDDIKGALEMSSKLGKKPYMKGKKRANGASINTTLEIFAKMESPKEKIKNSFDNSAKSNGYRRKELSKDDKKYIQNKLSNVSKSAGFQQYEMKKKENTYATVLNRDEFKKIFEKSWCEIFLNWNWGPYENEINKRRLELVGDDQ